MTTYDIAILGSGVAGTLAAAKIAQEHKNLKVLLLEFGKFFQKRRRALEGALGLFPNSDGKLYLNDKQKVLSLTNVRRLKSSEKYFKELVTPLMDLKITKDRPILASLEKKIKKSGFELSLNNYIQVYPKDIHNLSKHLGKLIMDGKNITCSFDNEIFNVTKQKNTFIINSERGEFSCKKILVCVGRSGWRWASQFYKTIGIIQDNNTSKFGIKVEIPTTHMREFNKSNCYVYNNDLEIGPLNWEGTVIPEDHVDVAISAFRSNEARWKTDKVSFNLIGNRKFDGSGFEQTDRISKLTFILANDRIMKEKISTLMNKKSKISIIPDYDWLPESINIVSNFIPDILSKGYFHVPTIIPSVPKININHDFSTDIEGMYCAGESSGITGIYAAALSGLIAADSICK